MQIANPARAELLKLHQISGPSAAVCKAATGLDYIHLTRDFGQKYSAFGEVVR